LRYTNFTQDTGATAVFGVLELNQQPIGIGEVQLGRALFRPAAIFHPQTDVVNERSWRSLRVPPRFDSVTLEDLDHLVGIEVIHAHAVVIDAGLPAGAAGKHQELDARA